MIKKTRTLFYVSIGLITLSVLVAITASLYPSQFVTHFYFQIAVGLFGFIGPLGGYLLAQYLYKVVPQDVYQLSQFEKECLFKVINRETKFGEPGVIVEAEVVLGALKGTYNVQLNVPNAYNNERYIIFGGQTIKLPN